MKKYNQISLSVIALLVVLGASCTATSPTANSTVNTTTTVDYTAQLLPPVEYCLPDNQPKQLTVPTDQTTDWKQYDGNLFSLYYPADLTVGASLGEDYATFVSPDGTVEFTVYAPYASVADPKELLPLATETVVVEDSLDGPLTCVTELGEAGSFALITTVVLANDGSYLRSIEDVNLIGDSTEVRNTFSIKYDTAESFEKYNTQFTQFMNSLVRNADA